MKEYWKFWIQAREISQEELRCQRNDHAQKTNHKKIFDEISWLLGFEGKGCNRYIEFPTYHLIVNYQKSAQGKLFYINIAIFYKELLDHPLTQKDIEDAYKTRPPVLRHVDFRIEDCPNVSRSLQKELDRLVKEELMNELRETLQDALEKVLKFMQDNHDRKKIRSLNDEKKFPAMLLKAV